MAEPEIAGDSITIDFVAGVNGCVRMYFWDEDRFAILELPGPDEAVDFLGIDLARDKQFRIFYANDESLKQVMGGLIAAGVDVSRIFYKALTDPNIPGVPIYLASDLSSDRYLTLTSGNGLLLITEQDSVSSEAEPRAAEQINDLSLKHHPIVINYVSPDVSINVLVMFDFLQEVAQTLDESGKQIFFGVASPSNRVDPNSGLTIAQIESAEETVRIVIELLEILSDTGINTNDLVATKNLAVPNRFNETSYKGKSNISHPHLSHLEEVSKLDWLRLASELFEAFGDPDHATLPNISEAVFHYERLHGKDGLTAEIKSQIESRMGVKI